MYVPLEEAAPVIGRSDRSCILFCMGRDELKAEHKANHLQVAGAPDARADDRAATAKVALFHAPGITVRPRDVAIAGAAP